MLTDRRLLFTIAGASLLLNVFLLGIVLGNYHARTQHHPLPARGAGLISAAHLRSLAPEDRRTFATAMASHRPAIRAAREAQRAARATVEADIAAPEFNKAKLADDFTALRQAAERAGDTVDTALVEALATLSPTARAALVAAVPKAAP